MSVQDRSKLRVVLAEYNALRQEIVRFGERQLQLFHIMLLALSFAYGYVIAYGAYDILCIVPVLVSPFVFRYIWDQHNSTLISKYLKEEIAGKTITRLIGYKCEEDCEEYERYWLGWQHYWDAVGAKPMQLRVLGWYGKHVGLLWIVFIAFAPSLIYSTLAIVSSYSRLVIPSFVPVYFHVLLLIGYMWLLLKVLRDKRLKVT